MINSQSPTSLMTSLGVRSVDPTEVPLGFWATRSVWASSSFRVAEWGGVMGQGSMRRPNWCHQQARFATADSVTQSQYFPRCALHATAGVGDEKMKGNRVNKRCWKIMQVLRNDIT